jgi:hypothetical protein
LGDVKRKRKKSGVEGSTFFVYAHSDSLSFIPTISPIPLISLEEMNQQEEPSNGEKAMGNEIDRKEPLPPDFAKLGAFAAPAANGRSLQVAAGQRVASRV